jgi:integrase
MKSNPARDAERASYATDGFPTWSVDEVRQFEARHPVGTKARLALALLLFTGSRRGDVVTFGRQHVKDGTLRFVPRKTRYKRMTPSEKPILPVLAEVINASPTGDLTFLVTDYGKPFTAAGFGGWFRDRCDEAGLPQCSAHGLRKAGRRRLVHLRAGFHSLHMRAPAAIRLRGDTGKCRLSRLGNFAIYSIWIPELYPTTIRATAFAWAISFGRLPSRYGLTSEPRTSATGESR